MHKHIILHFASPFADIDSLQTGCTKKTSSSNDVRSSGSNVMKAEVGEEPACSSYSIVIYPTWTIN